MYEPHPPGPQAPPIVAPPPVQPRPVAPPVVAALTNQHASPSFLDRRVRDFKIGGLCLIAGLVVGQTQWSRFAPTHSATRVRAIALPERVALESVPTAHDAPEPAGSTAAAATQPLSDQSLISSFNSQLAEIDVFEDLRSPLRPVAVDTPSVTEVAPEESSVSVEESPLLIAPTTEVSCSVAAKPIGDSLVSGQTLGKPVAPSVVSLEEFESRSTLLPMQCQDGTCQQKMESLGTELKWADTPADAYRLAGEQDKLVFLIHVSGNFEIPGFT